MRTTALKAAVDQNIRADCQEEITLWRHRNRRLWWAAIDEAVRLGLSRQRVVRAGDRA